MSEIKEITKEPKLALPSIFSANTNLMSKLEIREAILEVENKIRNSKQENRVVFSGDTDICPVKHTFADGIYVREIFIPKGTLLTGKIHNNANPDFLLQGEMIQVTEERGVENIKAPFYFISGAGTKKLGYAITDSIFVSVFHNPINTKNLKELEEKILSDNYIDYDRFIENNNKSISKLKKVLIKNLSL